jgi:hypothetical protein
MKVGSVGSGVIKGRRECSGKIKIETKKVDFRGVVLLMSRVPGMA